jgi:hypothetical protein
MPSNCPSSPSAFNAEAFNVTEWMTQRYPDPPNDEDRERLKQCWGYTDCGDCHRSKGFCGWCALVRAFLTLTPYSPLSLTPHHMTPYSIHVNSATNCSCALFQPPIFPFLFLHLESSNLTLIVPNLPSSPHGPVEQDIPAALTHLLQIHLRNRPRAL